MNHLLSPALLDAIHLHLRHITQRNDRCTHHMTKSSTIVSHGPLRSVFPFHPIRFLPHQINLTSSVFVFVYLCTETSVWLSPGRKRLFIQILINNLQPQATVVNSSHIHLCITPQTLVSLFCTKKTKISAISHSLAPLDRNLSDTLIQYTIGCP